VDVGRCSEGSRRVPVGGEVIDCATPEGAEDVTEDAGDDIARAALGVRGGSLKVTRAAGRGDGVAPASLPAVGKGTRDGLAEVGVLGELAAGVDGGCSSMGVTLGRAAFGTVRSARELTLRLVESPAGPEPGATAEPPKDMRLRARGE
jgi:hypothetical protein